VPNEPVIFKEEGKPRSEDEIIAYSFDKYMTTGDDTWPLLLPMAKSAVRAMDTVQTFTEDEPVPVEQFVVSGGSKRGWTTWLTAAVDDRVVAIIPAVIDALNMDEQMAHHYAAYGFYAPSVHDYVDKNIFDRFDTRSGQRLLKIVDPYEYRKRYTMPKFLLNSAGDQFFLPDSAQFYYYDLPGPKYIRYVPNTDHGLGDSDAWESVMAFYAAVVSDAALPRFTWIVEKPCTIRVVPQDKPLEVNLWQAAAPDSRDFRLETLGAKWTSSPLTPEANGDYVAAVEVPQKGWVAYFAELVYDSGLGVPYKFTTEVRVVPTTLPFADSATYGRSARSKQRRQPMKPCPCPSW
jgi:PhoPQ-activated pathogenicity-related protein